MRKNSAQAWGIVLIVMAGILFFVVLSVWSILAMNLWGAIIGIAGGAGWIWATKNFL